MFIKKGWKRLTFFFKIYKWVPTFFRFFLSKDIGAGKKALFMGGIVGYFFIPFDAIPDALMLLGIVDDVGVFVFMLEQMQHQLKKTNGKDAQIGKTSRVGRKKR